MEKDSGRLKMQAPPIHRALTYAGTCTLYMHDIQTKPPWSESGASLLAVSGTRERRREDSETEEVEECALSVIGAARRCIVPAVGMKTREFSQLLMCTQHEDVRAGLPLTAWRLSYP